MECVVTDLPLTPCRPLQGPFSCLNSARFGIAFGALGAAGEWRVPSLPTLDVTR
jgi:hypothetical protein